MKIFIKFNSESKETDVRIEMEDNDAMPVWDAMPYINDAIYEMLVQESKKHGLR